MIDTAATILENARQYGDYWRLTLRIPARLDVCAGQFVMIRPRRDGEPILRRAMVFYRLRAGSNFLDAEFIFKVIGRGTGELARLRPGDEVDLLAPLGNGYAIDSALTAGRSAVLVSGGVGIPALYLLAEQLRARRVKTHLFHGDRTSDIEKGLLCVHDFQQLLGCDAVVCATEDGSYGERGFVTAPLETALRRGRLQPAVVYACGPEPMMRRVAELAREFHLPAHLSLEAPMACGFGVCLACARRVNIDGQQRYVRLCMEGPIFRAEDIVWEE